MNIHFLNMRIDEYQNTKHYVNIKNFDGFLTQKNINKKDLKPYVLTLNTNLFSAYIEIWAYNVKDIYNNIHIDYDSLKFYYNKKVFKVTDPYIKNKKGEYIGY